MADNQSPTSNRFRERLVQDGWIRDDHSRITPLTGGVSSDIFLVEEGDKRFVAKRALEKLRVQQDWYADTSRIKTEIACLELFAEIAPGITPRIIAARPDHGYVLMEFLDSSFINWKSALLDGHCDAARAFAAGDTLGIIHRLTWNRPDLETRFNALENFRQLRLNPYFASLLNRHPDLQESVENEIHQLQGNRLCLMHGDYSPKNLLFSKDRIVVLDWETACYADPAFDIGFLLNHLILKAVHRPHQADEYHHLCQTAWNAYVMRIGAQRAAQVEPRLSHLSPLLLLARVDGKSPVEYLTDAGRHHLARAMARKALAAPFVGILPMCTGWIQQIKEWNHEHQSN